MSYRDDLDALAAHHAALSAELNTKQSEVDASARVLAEARRRAKLTVLDNIHVATPCPAKWSDMTGDDRVRACGACQKNVYDISMMTRAEAEALIVEKEGRLCLRYYQRADGTIMLKDCAIAVSKRGKRRWISLGAAALVAGTVAAAERGPAPQMLSSTPDTVEAAHPSWSYIPKKQQPGVLPLERMKELGSYTGGVASIFSREESLGAFIPTDGQPKK
jgi:hypothetical protein